MERLTNLGLARHAPELSQSGTALAERGKYFMLRLDVSFRIESPYISYDTCFYSDFLPRCTLLGHNNLPNFIYSFTTDQASSQYRQQGEAERGCASANTDEAEDFICASHSQISVTIWPYFRSLNLAIQHVPPESKPDLLFLLTIF